MVAAGTVGRGDSDLGAIMDSPLVALTEAEGDCEGDPGGGCDTAAETEASGTGDGVGEGDGLPDAGEPGDGEGLGLGDRELETEGVALGWPKVLLASVGDVSTGRAMIQPPSSAADSKANRSTTHQHLDDLIRDGEQEEQQPPPDSPFASSLRNTALPMEFSIAMGINLSVSLSAAMVTVTAPPELNQ